MHKIQVNMHQDGSNRKTEKSALAAAQKQKNTVKVKDSRTLKHMMNASWMLLRYLLNECKLFKLIRGNISAS